MTREELISLLKEYKENKARLNIKLKELKMNRLVLSGLDDIETSMTTSFGINSDIHSKNAISDKVSKAVAENESKKDEIIEKINNLENMVKELRDKVEW